MKRYKFLFDDNLFIHYNHTDYPETHCHSYWEITVFTSGKFTHYINNQTVSLVEDTICLIRPNDVHSFIKNGTDCGYITLGIKKEYMETSLKLFSEDIRNYFISSPYISLPISHADTLSIIDNTNLYLYSNVNSNANKSALLEYLYFFILSVIYKRIIQETNPNKTYSQSVLDLIQIMNKPENFNLKIQDIIKTSFYSHYHISKIFKKETGLTISQYYQNIKLFYAKTLLETTNMSIINIALTVNIASLSHFNSAFKAKFKMPPRTYRKHWKEAIKSFDDKNI